MIIQGEKALITAGRELHTSVLEQELGGEKMLFGRVAMKFEN